MSLKNVGFKNALSTEVIQTGKCSSCGACVVVCPFGSIELANGEPIPAKECKVCGSCVQACPICNWDLAKAEFFVFNKVRKPEDAFGIYRRIVIARTKNSDIQKVCQEGGATTAMLVAALESGLIDGAIVSASSQEKPFCPKPFLATSTQKIIEAAGTKYSCSSVLLALPEVAKQKKTQVAFVGTPCQIHAVRKMQMNNLKKFISPLKYIIGLMCSECFDYEGLIETYIRDKLGIKPSEIIKLNIKGKMFVTTSAGITVIPLADIKQYVRKNCNLCEDFSSELADISVGGLDLKGWTFVIIRTEKGEELFANAEKTGILETKPLEEGDFSKTLLLKLTKRKHENIATAEAKLKQ